MVEVKESVKSKLINYFCALAVCLSPILAPYRLVGPISMGLAFILIMSFFCILTNKKIVFHLPLLFIVSIHSILSLFAFFTTVYNIGSEAILWNVIIIFTRSFAFTQIVPYFEKNSFIKVVVSISALCSGFLIYQLVCVNLGIEAPSGQLFENMTSGYRWSNSITYLRPNSLFSEPSYFAIYLLPVMILMFIYNKYILGILCAFLLFLSTSTLGLIGGILALILYTIITKKYKNLIIIIAGIIFSILIYISAFDGEWLYRYTLNKLVHSYDNSSLRIWGFIDYFWMLPLINAFIGVGSGQMANFFINYGIPNYSNAFVIILINFGLLGFLAFLLFIKSLYSSTTDNGKVFLFILLFICSVDAFIYSENFFYVIFYVLVFSKQSYLSMAFVSNERKSFNHLMKG